MTPTPYWENESTSSRRPCTTSLTGPRKNLWWCTRLPPLSTSGGRRTTVTTSAATASASTPRVTHRDGAARAAATRTTAVPASVISVIASRREVVVTDSGQNGRAAATTAASVTPWATPRGTRSRGAASLPTRGTRNGSARAAAPATATGHHRAPPAAADWDACVATAKPTTAKATDHRARSTPPTRCHPACHRASSSPSGSATTTAVTHSAVSRDSDGPAQAAAAHPDTASTATGARA